MFNFVYIVCFLIFLFGCLIVACSCDGWDGCLVGLMGFECLRMFVLLEEFENFGVSIGLFLLAWRVRYFNACWILIYVY